MPLHGKLGEQRNEGSLGASVGSAAQPHHLPYGAPTDIGSIWSGYKSSPGDKFSVDTHGLGAMIIAAPVDSKGASLTGSLGSLLLAVRPRIQVLDAPPAGCSLGRVRGADGSDDQETGTSPTWVTEARIT